VLAEELVRAAIAVVAGQGEIRAEWLVGGAGGHDLAVGLDRHAIGLVEIATEAGEDFATSAETGVEAAAGGVAEHGEFEADVFLEDLAGGHDLAVGLERHAIEAGLAAAAGGHHLAAGAEAGVKRAVRVVAGQGEFVAAGRKAAILRTGNHDLAVRLDRHAPTAKGVGRTLAEICRDFTTAAEERIEAAAALVADQGKIVARAGLDRFAPGHDLA